MQKTSSWGSGAAELGLTAAKFAVIVPVVLGLGTGYLASRVTAPGETDADKLQKSFMNQKLMSETAKARRTLDHEIRKRL